MDEVQRLKNRLAIKLYRDRLKRNGLWHALAHGHVDIAEYLLRNGADANSKVIDGRTILYSVCHLEQDIARKAIQLLIDHGARIDPDYRSPDGGSYLIGFAKAGLAQNVAKLLDLGSDPDWVDDLGNCALAYACMRENTEIAGMLAPKTIMPHRNKDRLTPLMLAAEKCMDGVMGELLRTTSVDFTDLQGNTALFYAIRGRSLAAVALLLKNGADPNIVNKRNETPLYIACYHEWEEAAMMLLSFGAKTDTWVPTPPYLPTPLQLAIRNARLLQAMLDHGTKLSEVAQYFIWKWPLLPEAIMSGSLESAEILIKRGADINETFAEPGRPGQTVLWHMLQMKKAANPLDNLNGRTYDEIIDFIRNNGGS
jgi:ankyrin repeat protein